MRCSTPKWLAFLLGEKSKERTAWDRERFLSIIHGECTGRRLFLVLCTCVQETVRDLDFLAVFGGKGGLAARVAAEYAEHEDQEPWCAVGRLRLHAIPAKKDVM